MMFRSVIWWPALAVVWGVFGGSSWAGVAVRGLDASRITVVWTLEDLVLHEEQVAGTSVTAVSLPGAVLHREAGFPELPTVTVTLQIPGRGEPALRVVTRSEREIAAAPVRPSLGHVTRDRDPTVLVPVFGPIYGSAEVYPAVGAALARPFLLGDRRGVTVRLNPVRWDAGRGVLVVTDSLTIEITTAGSGGVNPLPTGVPASSPVFRDRHDPAFANAGPESAAKTQTAGVRARMLIVSHDDFLPALVPFQAWKARRGIPTSVLPLSSTDGTAAGLRKAIADDYLAAPGLTWLLLVGDKAQMPTNVGTFDGSDADTPYAMILGDDLYPELYVSRVSARTITDAETQLNKFVRYERDPDTGAAALWYARAAGVASNEGVPADSERAELLRAGLLSGDFSDVDRIYQELGATGAEISAAVNGGRSLVNYLGHGSGLSWDSVPFSTADVLGLANSSRLPWIVDVSCSNGDFALDTCFAEAWLRAGSPIAPAGAVGMVAASSLAPWTPPTVMQAEIVALLATGATRNLGALVYSGLVRVLDEYAGVPVATQVMEQNIVFGDASLQVRTRAPDVFAVELPSSVDPLGDRVTVFVVAPAVGTVAVTAGGTLLGATDFAGTGEVHVPVSGLADRPGVTITVTGPNMVPLTGDAVVMVGTTPVEDAATAIGPVLRGNYPNPFNPVTRIRFELSTATSVQLTVYDVGGRQVRRLADGGLGAGIHAVRWDGRDDAGRAVPSGMYLYRLETPQGGRTGRMVLAK